MNTNSCFEYSFAAVATDRDAPLTFAWRTAQSEVAALELRPAHNWRYEDARNAILTEAVLAAGQGRAVSYSRRKVHYVGRQRYYGPSYAYKTILAAVGDGVAAGRFPRSPVLFPLHPSIAYALRGVQFVGDPYETAEFPRDHGKAAFNIALNAKSYSAARAAIAHDLSLDMASATKLLRAITSKHRAISDLFFSDAGVRLMRIDSDITLNTVMGCQTNGIPVLPVHDSFITPAHQAGQTAEIMEACFTSRFPQSANCRVRIKSHPKPHAEKRDAA